MKRIVQLTSLVSLAVALAACQDVLAPANLGSLTVALDISGTPNKDSFGVEWSDTNSGVTGGAPFTVAFPRQTFEQVPQGETEVMLADLPGNCSATENTKTVEVMAQDTVDVHFTIQCQ